MDTSRNYKNPFQDYSNSSCLTILNPEENTITNNFKILLITNTKKLLQKLEENKNDWTYHDDHSIYTGSAGIANMFQLYADYFNEPVYYSKAIELLQNCIKKFKWKREITFLTGLSGPLALGAVIFHKHGNKNDSQNAISKLISLSTHVINEHSDIPDELLYGRAGYLFSLLYINTNICPPPIESDIIKQVISSIIKSGNIYSTSRHCKSPLMYSWHDTEYLGAAHGLAGILYILLQARDYLHEGQLKNYILPALYYLQDLKYPSGNFPSSIGSNTDKLIHWCHGAPGMTMLFCLAYEIYSDKKFLETAIQCGEVIWARGLLKKGYGICHGVSGNAYTFLHLYQQTKDLKYLYRACKYAEWCFNYGVNQNRIPDRPFSLFEGLAGVIYFLIDMQQPNMAKFPAYTL
uniref:lanC-like protein 2 isoform X1 n=1 Tax=Vespula vulgaris TaxID=7454 RepID=UPI0021377A84|nr:lanC-like protein 2 isoform X1 [Vespula vulgaris]XP_050858178.1 lanC-like protein 2 isoform X1 [Vespula vulgaris]